jgi:hypothetical protein
VISGMWELGESQFPEIRRRVENRAEIVIME